MHPGLRRLRAASLALLLASLLTLLSAPPARPTAAQSGEGARLFLPLLAGGGTALPPPPGAPVIERFYAENLSLAPGDATTLTWGVRGATGVHIGTLAVRPASTATYTLRAENSRGVATRTLTVAVVPWGSPDSAELIERALRSGGISAEQALAYRVYATFGDDRLPAALRGAPLAVDAAPPAQRPRRPKAALRWRLECLRYFDLSSSRPYPGPDDPPGARESALRFVYHAQPKPDRQPRAYLNAGA